MKFTITSLIASLVAVRSLSLSVPAAWADEQVCQGTIGAITVDNLKVPSGKTCTLNGTRVQGNIKVESQAILKANRVRVEGDIQADRSRNIEVSQGSVIGGNIQVKQGSATQITNTRIDGDLQFESNSGRLIATQNQIDGNLQAFQNFGGLSIQSNVVNGNLQCKENRPKPIGGFNMVRGDKEDQCSRL
ncbi:polymer-forming cytoskeletal protein [Synechococcus elongatus]|uniref:polymer-forming cytoskeletal protein n=1 Tax=Synechococcus elongatus TaxID=32046 RepID=UPI000F6F1038|nr:polymer-forming cytoskeletal protein [Synechococcus elongatus]AZB71699.1 hypothetical protein DOP62_02255 [Synechococcus elongatus PCC 11801]